MTVGVQLKKHRLKSHNLTLLLEVNNKHHTGYYPVGLFNVSKITKEHKPSRLCPSVIFLTFSRFLSVGYKNFAKLFRSFFPQDFSKNDIKDKRSVKVKMLFFCCNIRLQKSNCVLLKIKYSTFQNSHFAKFLQRRPSWCSTSSFSNTEYDICFS